ncbi:imelysin family protein [Hyphomicrobium sp. CS1BSMeth3]|uniref:imelysin family protein n=1 Tax=Hyphomicrobium sp. CS1BSMeth3 TaxID=1892844 RepID=UPI001FCD87B4|nr:imelysin family protein [Hyphomicrobium sp. CS1BSMeth3]
MSPGASTMASAATAREVINTYADIAQAAYEDSLASARKLKESIGTLVAKPSTETLAAAREAWKAARVPYMQTEAYRFGNKIVDEWESKVNAWPLDEGLIDYVDKSYGTASDTNPLYAANVIANTKLKIGGRMVDTSRITKKLLSETLHEAEKIEANVATGYHAIEFLLWGQDLNGTGPGAGNRPYTDYAKGKACTGGNCDRRARYLTVVTDLLVDDLAFMAAQWKPKGAARVALEKPDNEALTAIFTGLASLSYGEMAGERMKLGLLLNDPEEEHDCFSDNTHNSHYYDVVGIENVYLGRYKRIDGSMVSGPSVSDLVKAKSPEVDERVRKALGETIARMGALKQRAETVEAYDQMIGEGNAEGNAVVEAALGALIAQTKEFERAIAALELTSVKIEGSDSLDDPTKALSKKK